MSTLASLNFDAEPVDIALSPVSPWSVVGTAPIVRTAAAAHGAQGVRWDSTNTNGRVGYDTGSAFSTPHVVSFYFTVGTLPTANLFLASILDGVAGTTQGDLRMSAGGAISMRNGGSTAGSALDAITPGTRYRVEWMIDPANNQQTIRLYVGNSTTVFDESGPAAWSSDIGRVLTFGPRVGAAGGANLDYDSVVIADTWTGPWVGPPLAVDAGADQGIEADDNAVLDATVTGGETPYTYAWSVQSGGGAFDDDAIVDPVFTPTEAGVHVLRLTVTDDAASSDFDEVTITASDALAPVSVSGWTSIGGGAANRLAAVTDDNPATYVQTGDNPSSEVITMTLPPLSVPPGDLRAHVTLSLDLGTGSVTPRLYQPDGTTLVAAADPVSVTTDVVEYEVVFDAADLVAAGLDPEDDWALGMVMTLTAAI